MSCSDLCSGRHLCLLEGAWIGHDGSGQTGLEAVAMVQLIDGDSGKNHETP